MGMARARSIRLHRQVRRDVDKREQEQPHHVDEMPIPGSGFEAEMLGGRELPRHQTEQAHRQEDGADDHVRAMEAGSHEK